MWSLSPSLFCLAKLNFSLSTANSDQGREDLLSLKSDQVVVTPPVLWHEQNHPLSYGHKLCHELQKWLIPNEFMKTGPDDQVLRMHLVSTVLFFSTLVFQDVPCLNGASTVWLFSHKCLLADFGKIRWCYCLSLAHKSHHGKGHDNLWVSSVTSSLFWLWPLGMPCLYHWGSGQWQVQSYCERWEGRTGNDTSQLELILFFSEIQKHNWNISRVSKFSPIPIVLYLRGNSICSFFPPTPVQAKGGY